MARRVAPAQFKSVEKGSDGAVSARRPRGDIRAYATLKPAGGSLVMTVPAVIRKALSLGAGAELAVTVEGNKMVVEAMHPTPTSVSARRPKYTLDELLADANSDASLSDEERAWHDTTPVGREVW